MTISSQLVLTRELGVSHANFKVKYANTTLNYKGSHCSHQCWTCVRGNALYQQPTSMMASKNVSMGIQIIILVKQ